MEEKKDWVRTISLGSFILLVIVVVLIFICSKYSYSFFEKGIVNLNDGWTVTYTDTDNNVINEQISLPYYAASDMSDAGLDLEGTVPEDIDGAVYLYIEGHHQSIVVYVDGQERASFEKKEEIAFGNTVPSNFYSLKLLESDAGKNICIHYESYYPKYRKHIRDIYLGSQNQFTTMMIDKYILDFSAGCLLIILGLFWVTVYLILVSIFNKKSDINYIGYFGIMMGVWVITDLRARQLYFTDIFAIDKISYILMDTFAVPFIQYIATRVSKKYQKSMNIISLLLVLNATVLFFLDFFNIVDLCITKEYTGVAVAVALVYSFVIMLLELKNKNDNVKSSLIAIFVMIVFGLLKYATYYFLPVDSSSNLPIYIGVTAMMTIMGLNNLKAWISLEQERRNSVYANKAKSDFLANMSHEIRTPITAVLGLNEMILNESDSPSITDHAIKIRNAGKLLLSIVNDILDFSKIESGKMELVYSEYETFTVLNDVVSMVKSRMAGKPLDLIIDVDETIPGKLYGDDMRLRQVVTNILTNAVKYTRKGSVTLTANVIDRDEENVYVRVAVKDTGIGIKKEDIDSLFESFRRLDQQYNRNIEGTGLGLNITNKFLEMMDSKLQVESTYGKGSVFFFEIKQKIVDASPIGNFNEAMKQFETDKEISHRGFIAPDARVLLVDDNELNLEVIQGFLSETKIQITTANRGARALELVKAFQYDLLLLDHMMPGMDGIETLAHIREYENQEKEKGRDIKQLPVVVLTANAISGAKEMYMSKGFQDYLVKPIESEELERVLKTYIPKEYIQEIELQEEVNTSNNDSIQKPLRAENKAEIYLKEYGINTQDGIKYSGGKEAKYKMMLNAYLKFDPPRREKLKKFKDEGDMAAYAIEVHALKGNAKGIGAASLAEIAYTHEKASKDGDQQTVDVLFNELIDKMDLVNKGITAILNEGITLEKPEAKVVTEDIGTRESIDAVKLIKSNPVSLGNSEKTRNSNALLLKEYVEDYDRKEALKLIEKWLNTENSITVVTQLNRLSKSLQEFELEKAVIEVTTLVNIIQENKY